MVFAILVVPSRGQLVHARKNVNHLKKGGLKIEAQKGDFDSPDRKPKSGL